jgi:hypothetical protein
MNRRLLRLILAALCILASLSPALSLAATLAASQLPSAKVAVPPAGWIVETVVDAGQPLRGQALDLDTQNRPHIAYITDDGYLRIASFDGSDWTTSTVTDGATGIPDLVLDDGNVPHMVYTHPGPQIYYATEVGDNWVTTLVDGDMAEDRMAAGARLTLDAAGHPHLAYQDPRPTSLPWANGIIYAEWDGAVWQKHTIDRSIAGCENSCDLVPIALDDVGQPRVAYRDTANNQLWYAAWNGSNWVRKSIDSEGIGPKLALGAGGVPHVAYTRPGPDVFYATVVGGDFQPRPVDGDVVIDPALALDRYGNPHVAYCDARPDPPGGPGLGLKYAYLQSGLWQVVILDTSQCENPAISLDSDGSPHITYYDMVHGTVGYAHTPMASESASVPTTGGTLNSPDDQTTYVFGTNAFAAEVEVTHTQVFGGSLPQLGDLKEIGHAFDTTAVFSNSHLPADLAPGQNYQIRVQYTAQELGLVDKVSLALYYWDGSDWIKESSSKVDTASSIVSATPQHFSLWAVLGTPRRVYLPIVLRGTS